MKQTLSFPSSTPYLAILVGFPSSGKSTLTKKILKHHSKHYPDKEITVVSRDLLGGTVKQWLPLIEHLLNEKVSVIVDNTHLTKESRKAYVDLAKEHSIPILAYYLETTIEDCQIRYLYRTWNKYQDLFLTTPLPKKDPNVYPPAVFFKARKELQIPTQEEGFTSVESVTGTLPKFDNAHFPNKALFLDIDGTLRETEHLPLKYPTDPSQIQMIRDVKTVMRPVLQKYIDEGYQLIGVSNQSGISKGTVTEEQVTQCMNRTKELLHLPSPHRNFPISFCPHRPAPIQCYCRKPQVGLAMQYILSQKINPYQSIMVGDSTGDKTMAERFKMKFIHTNDFWKKE
jgi:histidinol-phosphate phosphatase family protein